MDLDVEQIARVCHEASRAYCIALGDHSVPAWDVAPAWQKDSAIAGVKSALAEPDKSPEQSHYEWMEHKLKAGWTYGPEKRPEVLQHPCLCPWEELPPEQKLKDNLFISIVRAIGKLSTASDAEVAKAVVLHESEHQPPSGDTTQETGVLMPDGEVVKDAKIEERVVGHERRKKRRE